MFKILIAEDDRELRQLFAHVLTKNGYTVLGVSNGDGGALPRWSRLLRPHHLRHMMPKMDGYELVRSVREASSSIPIMITARTPLTICVLAFSPAATIIWSSPSTSAKWSLRVKRSCAARRWRRERRSSTARSWNATRSASPSAAGMVLPQKEFMLLYKMASFPGRIFTRQRLMDTTSGATIPAPIPTPLMCIARLRDFPRQFRLQIVTMRGGRL